MVRTAVANANFRYACPSTVCNREVGTEACSTHKTTWVVGSCNGGQRDIQRFKRLHVAVTRTCRAGSVGSHVVGGVEGQAVQATGVVARGVRRSKLCFGIAGGGVLVGVAPAACLIVPLEKGHLPSEFVFSRFSMIFISNLF